MATWHQQKAGLSGLYAPHLTDWAVVVDPPGECAARIEFRLKRDAERYMRQANKKHSRGVTLVKPTREQIRTRGRG